MKVTSNLAHFRYVRVNKIRDFFFHLDLKKYNSYRILFQRIALDRFNTPKQARAFALFPCPTFIQVYGIGEHQKACTVKAKFLSFIKNKNK
jgi:hypothetical protein